MLLFIGGASRTGKGIPVRRLLAEIGSPFLSLDIVKMGLIRGVPEFILEPDGGGLKVTERMWPVVWQMGATLLDERIDYVLEGELAPKHICELRQAYPSDVDACFVGYAAISPEQKLRELRRHSGHPNDWPAGFSDDEMLPMITKMIAFSQYLKEECARCGFRYFDTSLAFNETLHQVVAHVRRLVPPNTTGETQGRSGA